MPRYATKSAQSRVYERVTMLLLREESGAVVKEEIRVERVMATFTRRYRAAVVDECCATGTARYAVARQMAQRQSALQVVLGYARRSRRRERYCHTVYVYCCVVCRCAVVVRARRCCYASAERGRGEESTITIMPPASRCLQRAQRRC